LARNREVVHGGADNDHVGGKKVIHCALTGLELALQFGIARSGRRGPRTQQFTGQMAQRLAGEIEVANLAARILALPFADHRRAKFARCRLCPENARIDMQEFHCSSSIRSDVGRFQDSYTMLGTMA